MKERLIIKNFGPIKEADLTFGRFNVLIGEQATGKSTVAKLLAVCRYFSFISGNDNHTFPSDHFVQGLVAWGLGDSINSDSEIFYESEDYSFRADRVKREDIILVPIDGSQQFNYEGFRTIILPKSERFKGLLSELEILKSTKQGEYEYDEPFWRIPTSFFKNRVASVMDNPFYIPTERGLQSIFSLGKSSIQNISDSLFNQFAKLDQTARIFKSDTTIEPLNIIYKNVNGHGFIRKKNEDKFYSLYNAASGYQSTIPVVLVAKYYTEISRKLKTFIIEEPELNLFPTAQNELMKFLVNMTMNFGNTTLIATHSPYVLAALNNLMSAYAAGKKDQDSTEQIIPKQYWLDHEDCTAYRMMPDGTCKDIFDREEGLIKSEEIDEISDVLNRQFDESLNIQFWKK